MKMNVLEEDEGKTVKSRFSIMVMNGRYVWNVVQIIE